MNKYVTQQNKLNFITELIKINKSVEYAQYLKENNKASNLIQKFRKHNYCGVTFLDLVNNEQLNLLTKHLSHLDKAKFNVKLHLKAPKWRKIDYFRLQYDSSSINLLGSVELRNDSFIKEINVSYSQINNNEAIIEYRIYFKSVIQYDQIVNFLEANESIYIKQNFTDYYSLNRDMAFSDNDFILTKTFKQMLQSKLSEIAKLGIGNKYTLPSILVIEFPKGQYKEKEFRNIFLGTMIKINSNQYLVYDYTYDEGLEMEIYFTGSKYPNISFISLISKLRMNFYFFLFGKIEHLELENHMNKYFGRSNQKINLTDYKWLVNKIRSIRDNTIHPNRNQTQIPEFSGWKQYRNGKLVELDFKKTNLANKHEIIFTECLRHIEILYGLQKENFIIYMTTLTLIFTVISIIVSIFNK